MLLLADENFPRATVEDLRANGHNVLWVRTDAPGSSDIALLDRAELESRILVTLDRDFWQVALQRRKPLVRSGVILFRVHPAVPDALTPIVRRALAVAREWVGHISVVGREGIQMVAAARQPG